MYVPSDISKYGRPSVPGSFFALVCLNFLLVPLSYPEDASVMWTMCVMSVVVGYLLVMTLLYSSFSVTVLGVYGYLQFVLSLLLLSPHDKHYTFSCLPQIV